jgi:cell division protein FtsB
MPGGQFCVAEAQSRLQKLHKADSVTRDSFGIRVRLVMSFGRAFKRRVRDALLPLGFIALCGYFAWHAKHGEFGLMARERRLSQIADARITLERLQKERDAMERKVSGMRSDNLDRDQLDERARALHNLVERDELIVPYDQGKRLY